MARHVPADLEDALAGSPAARDRFWSLPPEQKDAWVGYVARARVPGARRRRIAETVHRLNGGAPAGARAAAVALPRESWAVWLVGLALLAGLAAFLLWLTVYRHHDGSKPSAVVVSATSTVPKVTGIRYQAAQFQLQEAKLGSTIARVASRKPKGIVLKQTPKDGKRVPRGTQVALVVSKGPAGVALPNLVGLAAADALRVLRERKLKPTLEQKPSQQAPGTVLAQAPKPGTRAKPGTAVVLQVAKGAPAPAQTTQTAPAATTSQSPSPARPAGNDYRGLRLAAAARKIAAGRQQVIVQYVTSSQPVGVVVANAAAGGRVRLQVSAGAQPQPAADVPDTTGEDAATAQQDLESAGFTVLRVAWPVSDAANDGMVVFETPGPRAPGGATIVLYIGSVTGG